MKTTKNAVRSPMQMTIVAFVLLFVAITATILVMYFKWFANDELGVPAAVNVVGVEKNMVDDENIESQTEDAGMPGLYDDFPKDMVEKLVPSEGFQVFSSVLSHKGDQLVYFESNGVDRNIVLLNLVTKEKTVKKLDINSGCLQGDYIPFAWSPKDIKIILRFVVGDGCNMMPGLEVNSILDVKTLSDVRLNSHDPIFLNDYADVIYLNISETKPFCSIGVYYDQIIYENIESGETEILVENKDGNEVYSDLLLLPNGELQYASQAGYFEAPCYIVENPEEKEIRTLKLE
ncbi:MAG TPA: hypothetical protein PL066_03260 [bacterium]|nr:hypothetical protein [bacterium]